MSNEFQVGKQEVEQGAGATAQGINSKIQGYHIGTKNAQLRCTSVLLVHPFDTAWIYVKVQLGIVYGCTRDEE
jgi:hypothetical protein